MSNKDEVTLGGKRRKRASEYPTLREAMTNLTGSRIVIQPPTRKYALELAERFLSGPYGQRDVGRDGCELMARRLQADAEERGESW